jgi:hypothetical protein
VDLTVYGPRVELHSGHYGNWAPNPAMLLARLLASMKSDAGRVLIDHFYDGIEPLSPTEKRAIADAPNIDAELVCRSTYSSGRSVRARSSFPSPTTTIISTASTRTFGFRICGMASS